MLMNRSCYFSRVAETVEDIREVCSGVGSLLGRTVFWKSNSQFVQQAHGVLILEHTFTLNMFG